MMNKTTLPLLLLSVALPLGCAKKTADTAVVEPTTAEAPPPEEIPEKDPNQSAIAVDEEIAKLCELDQARFDFNSAKLSSSAKKVLDQLVECFTTGNAAGKQMRLVGHADPRGDEEYNLALGQRRAGSVAKYMSKKGLGKDRVETSSRGELDATGTDEASWAADRRVDIVMAN